MKAATPTIRPIPGGPTNWGITIHDARAYWKEDATAADVRNMPVEVAKDIYRSKYWDAMRCDELPAGVDYAVFDYGVNSGIGRAGKVLRRLVALSDRTSAITNEVIAAATRCEPGVGRPRARGAVRRAGHGCQGAAE